jgi:glycerol uptake facilitator-like aquaporin
MSTSSQSQSSSDLPPKPTGAESIRKYIREGVATMLLVFFGLFAGAEAALSLLSPTEVANNYALGFGLSALFLVVVFGSDMNTSITCAKATAGDIKPTEAGITLVIQVIGAAAGTYLVTVFLGPKFATVALAGLPTLAKNFSSWQGFGLEYLLNVLLALAAISLAAKSGVERAISGVVVGTILYLAVRLAGPLTGGAINGARALGSMILIVAFGGFSSFAPYWLLYIFASVLGGITAGLMSKYLFRPDRPRSDVTLRVDEPEALVLLSGPGNYTRPDGPVIPVSGGGTSVLPGASPYGSRSYYNRTPTS